jgi:AraC family transcriptional regulator, regulatory protein of adaptative response / methylated-DNA-[protein]-cysteine methyltransferase
MTPQEDVQYDRIRDAIEYISLHFKEQPSLEEMAAAVHLSPFHFQRLFHEWAGTTPKKFLQYTSLAYAKHLLREDSSATLFDTSMETGLSGTSRLHDLFVSIEGMTPAEYKHGGQGLHIHYSFAESPFGKLAIASTHKGICKMAFIDQEDEALADLKKDFPGARFERKLDMIQQHGLFIFQRNWQNLPAVKLHLKGTPFQLKVWEALLKIPAGRLSTYGKIGEEIMMPTASRAIGTAVGSNPVAYLIPCHRVIQSTGAIGGYMWGPVRKKAMIGWEAAMTAG